MAGWVWALIAIVAIVVVVIVAWRVLSARKTQGLQERFGPEYDRAQQTVGGKREAEAELAAREERREHLNIRPLRAEARQRYADQWQNVQTQFVDSPVAAVAAADGLVSSVMSDRGYPMDEFEQRVADVSVDHPQVVENYRAAHRISESSANGDATTEDQRQAMQLYRSLFDELLDSGGSAADTDDESPDRSIRSIERTTRNG
jgi:hypothetical protein